MRGGAAGFLGLAFWTSGDLEAAHRTYADGMANLRQAGNISDAIGGAITLADIRIAQGRLHEAMTHLRAGIAAGDGAGHAGTCRRGTADMYVGMSELDREHNDLHAATQHLLRSQELGEHTGLPAKPVSLARCDGSHPGGSGRSGRRSRPARRGRAPVRE